MFCICWHEAANNSSGYLTCSIIQALFCHRQVNFIAVHHLLDFGSGFDSILMAKNRRDWKETLQFVSEVANPLWQN